VHHAAQASQNEIRTALESNDEEAKVDAMQKAITAILAGEQLPALFITIVRYVLPSENHMVQKLLLLYLVSRQCRAASYGVCRRVLLAQDKLLALGRLGCMPVHAKCVLPRWGGDQGYLAGMPCIDGLLRCYLVLPCRRRSRRRTRPASCCPRWCAAAGSHGGMGSSAAAAAGSWAGSHSTLCRSLSHGL